jgi:hypothetical protein
MTEALQEDRSAEEPEGFDRDDREAGLPPPTAVESLVGAFLEAGPEVAEHVVRAAQELLAAAQCIVDAAQDAIQEQQDVRRVAREAAGDDDGAAEAKLLHLDVAE